MFIVNDDFSLSYGDFTIFNMAASAVLNFRNLEFMSRGLHGQLAMLVCFPVQISLTPNNRLLSYVPEVVWLAVAQYYFWFCIW